MLPLLLGRPVFLPNNTGKPELERASPGTSRAQESGPICPKTPKATEGDQRGDIRSLAIGFPVDFNLRAKG